MLLRIRLPAHQTIHWPPKVSFTSGGPNGDYHLMDRWRFGNGCGRGQALWSQPTRRLSTKAGHAIYARRKTIVEPVFGQIKQAQGFRSFLLRGVEKVRGEWALVCAAHNVLKLYRTTIALKVRSERPDSNLSSGWKRSDWCSRGTAKQSVIRYNRLTLCQTGYSDGLLGAT